MKKQDLYTEPGDLPENDMTIRVETESDYEAVYDVVKSAFATTSFSDGTEADYLNRIRKKPCFIPELSLVAEDDEKIVGQVVLYKAEIDAPGRTITQLVLSPLSVSPDCFRRGIGGSLIQEGCRRAQLLGYQAVFLCGDKTYYARFGFSPTCAYGIFHKKDTSRSAEWCMVKELEHGYLQGVTGLIDIE